MTKTEMAEDLLDQVDKVVDTYLRHTDLYTLYTFTRHFKELFEDLKVKIQEQVEESIEEEEAEFVEEVNDEVFGGNAMEGE